MNRVFKSFPVLKHFRTHELVAVLFLKRYGFDISRYQAPIIIGRLLVNTQISAAALVKYFSVRARRLIDHLLILLKSDLFPCNCCEGIITPIYKSETKNDPSNYRGICLSSCLGKLFTSILKRLKKTCPPTKHFTFCSNRFRTKPSHLRYNHTTNFKCKVCIQCIKYSQREIIYVVIDFKIKKDGHGLFYKLLQYNIGGRFYDLIKTPLLQVEMFWLRLIIRERIFELP